MIELSGHKAIVTGGAQGIGLNVSQALAAAGADVAIIDLQADRIGSIIAQRPASDGQLIPLLADISSEEACRNIVQEAVNKLGGLDIIVNCAAPGRDRTMVGTLNGADWPDHEQVILSAVVNIIDAAEEHLTKSEHASIVSISSVVSQAIALDHCSWPYHVSKAGLDHLTRWLAVRMGPRGIRVNAVAPGLINRDGWGESDHDPMRSTIASTVIPLGRGGTATEVSNAVLFLCSNYASYITGQVLVIDGGLNLSEVYNTATRIYGATQDNDKTD